MLQIIAWVETNKPAIQKSSHFFDQTTNTQSSSFAARVSINVKHLQATSSGEVAVRPTAFNGGPVLLTRVKCLVSMTTPRDIRLHGAAITPSFVEFDMRLEGFGCMYLPSIAPQGPVTPSVVSAGMIGGTDQTVVTGIGTGMWDVRHSGYGPGLN